MLHSSNSQEIKMQNLKKNIEYLKCLKVFVIKQLKCYNCHIGLKMMLVQK